MVTFGKFALVAGRGKKKREEDGDVLSCSSWEGGTMQIQCFFDT